MGHSERRRRMVQSSHSDLRQWKELLNPLMSSVEGTHLPLLGASRFWNEWLQVE